MLCRFCGKQIADDAEYCSYCGRKVLRVPPVFTMTNIGTGVATDAIRNYSEWGFYNNPDAELDPETGQKRETEFDTLKTLPEENPKRPSRKSTRTLTKTRKRKQIHFRRRGFRLP